MHKCLILFWWAVGLIQAHADEDFLFNDEFPSTFLGPISPSDDISSIWPTQDLPTDTSLATIISAEDNPSCSAGSSGFFVGRKRIRSIICDVNLGTGDDQSTTRSDDQPATSDRELEELIKTLEIPWNDNDDDSAVSDYNGSGIQRARICPDFANLGQVLPVCSSGVKKDVVYAPFTGEAKLEWCTLSMCFSNVDHVSMSWDTDLRS